MDGDGGGCDSDRGMSNTRLAARANHAVAAELHTTCGIPKCWKRYKSADCVSIRGPLFTTELDETQQVHTHHEEEKQEFHTNISTHPHIHVDGARRGPVRRPASRWRRARDALRERGQSRTGRTRAFSSTRQKT